MNSSTRSSCVVPKLNAWIQVPKITLGTPRQRSPANVAILRLRGGRASMSVLFGLMGLSSGLFPSASRDLCRLFVPVSNGTGAECSNVVSETLARFGLCSSPAKGTVRIFASQRAGRLQCRGARTLSAPLPRVPLRRDRSCNSWHPFKARSPLPTMKPPRPSALAAVMDRACAGTSTPRCPGAS